MTIADTARQQLEIVFKIGWGEVRVEFYTFEPNASLDSGSGRLRDFQRKKSPASWRGFV